MFVSELACDEPDENERVCVSLSLWLHSFSLLFKVKKHGHGVLVADWLKVNKETEFLLDYIYVRRAYIGSSIFGT